MPNDDDHMSALADMSTAQAIDRSMPSFCILGGWCARDPGGVAAPCGPPSTQFPLVQRGESPRTVRASPGV